MSKNSRLFESEDSTFSIAKSIFGQLSLDCTSYVQRTFMIDGLIRKIRDGLYEYSQHAVDQSIVRIISAREIREAIEHGKIKEDYPDDKYGPSCLIYGKTNEGRPIHVQCSYPSRPLIKTITVYEPDAALWVNFEIRR